ncbi:MAG: hypothetical protein KGD67_12860, partial [Candidatus Lokiarchaeota archaeon]|nr:hypothetical protein [Candidatus Lokiarchaeota archaeon]
MNLLNFDLQLQLADYLLRYYPNSLSKLIDINSDFYPVILYILRKYRYTVNVLKFIGYIKNDLNIIINLKTLTFDQLKRIIRFLFGPPDLSHFILANVDEDEDEEYQELPKVYN